MWTYSSCNTNAFNTVWYSDSHHTATEVGLDFFWFHILQIQDVQLRLGPFQDLLTVQHALLKISRLLEQLVLCRDFSEFPLKWSKWRFFLIWQMCSIKAVLFLHTGSIGFIFSLQVKSAYSNVLQQRSVLPEGDPAWFHHGQPCHQW